MVREYEHAHMCFTSHQLCADTCHRTYNHRIVIRPTSTMLYEGNQLPLASKKNNVVVGPTIAAVPPRQVFLYAN
eukprot:scaffold26690_cov162-Cylindrotheca_fusiformis.AAC.1